MVSGVACLMNVFGLGNPMSLPFTLGLFPLHHSTVQESGAKRTMHSNQVRHETSSALNWEIFPHMPAKCPKLGKAAA